MQSTSGIKSHIESGALKEKFLELYGYDAKERYLEAVCGFESEFGKAEAAVFSVPGRTEICGNHTDHQDGRVIAASIDLDIVAVVAKTDTDVARIKSEGYKLFEININEGDVCESERNTLAALARGVITRFQQLGLCVGGFDLFIVSDIPEGTGLSSSAALEMLIGIALSDLYNDGKVDETLIAKTGRYAENVYFGKPSGLMDQISCMVGGFIGIDFYDIKNPVIEKIQFDFSKTGHKLCIVDTGGSHKDLTPDYAGITYDMRRVANFLGCDVLGRASKTEFYKNLPEIRLNCGDRAALRALHFFDENERVKKLTEALKKNDFSVFKQILSESGNSSCLYNQNAYSTSNFNEQGILIGLAISEKALGGRGVYRLHGGGFAGTIQAFVPDDVVAEYKTALEKVFGTGSCATLNIRSAGGIRII